MPDTRRMRLLSGLVRDVIAGLCIVGSILLIDTLSPEYPFLRPFSGALLSAEDAAADVLLPLYRHTLTVPEHSVGLSLVNIDDTTYYSWGAPLITPRDKLAAIIEYVSSGYPKLIVIDIDFSRRSDLISRTPTTDIMLPAQDQRLLSTLKRLSKAGPPIVLVRDAELGRRDPACAQEYQQVTSSFLDAAVVAAPGILFWSSPLFERDLDLVIRHSRLMEYACRNGEAFAVPSVQLLVYTLIRDPAAAPRLYRLETADGTGVAIPKEIEVAGKIVPVTKTGPHSRLLYTFDWPLPSSATSGGVGLPKEFPGRAQVLVDGLREDAFLSIPAWMVTDPEPAERVPASVFHDRVVIIGGTYKDSRDLYQTPIGPMPGVLVIANAINGLVSYGILDSPSDMYKILTAVCLVILVSLVFAIFQYTVASLVSLAFVFITGLLLNYASISNGLWVDTAIPALALTCFKWFLAGYSAITQRKLGWWALVHPRWRPGNIDEFDDATLSPVDEITEGNTHRDPPRLLMIISLISFFSSCPARAEQVVSARIIGYSPPSIDYAIRRTRADGNIDIIPVAYYLPLLLGDRIIIGRSDGWMDIDIGGGSRIHLRYQDSPFAVPRRLGTPPTVFSNAGHYLVEYLNHLGNWLTLRENLRLSEPVSAITRGDTFSIPLLNGTQQITSGVRDIQFAWIGQVKELELRGPDNMLVTRAESIAGSVFGPIRLNMLPGRYRLSLADISGSSVDREFVVIDTPHPNLPGLDNELSIPSAKSMVSLAWLAEQNSGAWRFEAFLDSWQVEGGGPDLQSLQEALVSGVALP